MKGTLKKLIVLAAALFAAAGVAAQDADRIVGIYKAVEEGKESKVEFTRRPDGTYRGQIVWLRNPNNPDGTPKLDAKNPDKSKRSGRADRVVVVDGVKYDAEKGVWNGGRVYDPTKGKSYKVEVSFEDDRTLRVKGSLLGFSRSVYWKKSNKCAFFAPGRSIFRICTFISHNLVLKFL